MVEVGLLYETHTYRDQVFGLVAGCLADVFPDQACLLMQEARISYTTFRKYRWREKQGSKAKSSELVQKPGKPRKYPD